MEKYKLIVWILGCYSFCSCYFLTVVVASASAAAAHQDDHQDGNEAYRGFLDQLAQANVDEYVDLPMIAVMGDTSSGKSTLLSMISQVELPSHDSLTTRCPIMLHMQKAPTQSAVVKVLWKERPTSYTGGLEDFAERKVDESNWHKLTNYILEAQQHIINNNGEWWYHNKKKAVFVARDIVSLEVKGPNVENLTLIDLPGIARSYGKDEGATLPDEIQSLLEEYLKNPRCVILAVLPSNVDFHNSQIMAEALKVDPETKRTIPVLTKPDLIDSGAEDSVKELLLGHKTHDFEMGFHMVKGRGQRALNDKVSIEEGLIQESEFFDQTDPWRSIDDRSLFGTVNLRRKLGDLQMRLIRESFVSIAADIQAKREEALQARARLGEIPFELNEKIALFGKVKDEYHMTIGPLVLGGHVRGSQQRYLNKRNRKKKKPSADFLVASKNFMEALNSSRLATIAEVSDGDDVIAFVDGQEVKARVCHIKDGKVYLDTPEPCHNTESDGWFSYGDAYDDYAEMLAAIPMGAVRRDPGWIRDMIEMDRAYGLPIFANTEVFEGIVATLIDEDWRRPCLDLLDYTSALMKTAADDYVRSIDEIESLPLLRQFLLIASSNVVQELNNEALEKVVGFLYREKTPYTQNADLFENFSRVRSKHLMDELLNKLNGDSSAARVSGMLYFKKSDVEDIVKSVFERDQTKPMDDHMAEEIQHALSEYGKIALKRFIDNIPMICIEILQEFPKRINAALSNISDEEIDRLLVPPPDKTLLLRLVLFFVEEDVDALRRRGAKLVPSIFGGGGVRGLLLAAVAAALLFLMVTDARGTFRRFGSTSTTEIEWLPSESSLRNRTGRLGVSAAATGPAPATSNSSSIYLMGDTLGAISLFRGPRQGRFGGFSFVGAVDGTRHRTTPCRSRWISSAGAVTALAHALGRFLFRRTSRVPFGGLWFGRAPNDGTRQRTAPCGSGWISSAAAAVIALAHALGRFLFRRTSHVGLGRSWFGRTAVDGTRQRTTPCGSRWISSAAAVAAHARALGRFLFRRRGHVAFGGLWFGRTADDGTRQRTTPCGSGWISSAAVVTALAHALGRFLFRRTSHVPFGGLWFGRAADDGTRQRTAPCGSGWISSAAAVTALAHALGRFLLRRTSHVPFGGLWFGRAADDGTRQRTAPCGSGWISSAAAAAAAAAAVIALAHALERFLLTRTRHVGLGGPWFGRTAVDGTRQRTAPCGSGWISSAAAVTAHARALGRCLFRRTSHVAFGGLWFGRAAVDDGTRQRTTPCVSGWISSAVAVAVAVATVAALAHALGRFLFGFGGGL
eukprot:scaffold1027_cov108-Cylindrotheca_fusiformis.AAC.3